MGHWVERHVRTLSVSSAVPDAAGESTQGRVLESVLSSGPVSNPGGPPESSGWLRDTLYREDNSTVRTRSGPRAMATLRNLAAGALQLAGRHDTTEATRWARRNMDRPFTISQTHVTILKRPRRRHRVQAAGVRRAPRSTRDSSRLP